MSVIRNRLGFILMTVPRGDGAQCVARFVCTRCPATYDVNLKAGVGISPEHIAKRAARDGWLTDASRQSRTLCPVCLKPISDMIKNPESSMVLAIQMKPPALPAPRPPMTISATAIPTVNSLTADQRVQVRGYLDKSFDDSVGMYLDGMSDQRIAEILDVPWIIVQQVREAAYGPIRISADVVEMRGEMAHLKRDISALAERAAKLEQRLAKVGAYPLT